MRMPASTLLLLQDVVAASVRAAHPIFTTDQSWVLARKLVQDLELHPEIKISRSGVNKVSGKDPVTQ